MKHRFSYPPLAKIGEFHYPLCKAHDGRASSSQHYVRQDQTHSKSRNRNHYTKARAAVKDKDNSLTVREAQVQQILTSECQKDAAHVIFCKMGQYFLGQY